MNKPREVDKDTWNLYDKGWKQLLDGSWVKCGAFLDTKDGSGVTKEGAIELQGILDAFNED